MKKLLIILMVVTMAFLFVGCLGTTPPIDPVDPDEPVVPGPASTSPTIFDIQDSDEKSIVDVTATGTEYINKTEAGTYILVTGIASPEALVKVYVGSAATPVAAGIATKSGLFSVAVAKAALGADSLVAKTLYVTSIELALTESVASNVATFILDTAGPYVKKVAATGPATTAGTVTVTFNEVLSELGDLLNWSVVNATNPPTGGITVQTAKSTSDNKVVELGVTYATATAKDEIFVTYTGFGPNVKDLAGNSASVSSGTCLFVLET